MLWRIPAVVFSGAIQALCSPPVNLWWLHWVSWIPFLLAIDRPRGSRGQFLLGWLCGISACASIFSWIVDTVQNFSNLPLPLAWATLLLFSAAFGAYTGFVALLFPRLKERCGSWWPLGFAILFTAIEFVNPQLFPFYQGVTSYQQSWFFLIVSITGAPGVTFLMMLFAGLLTASIQTLHLKVGPVGRPHLARGWAIFATLFLFSVVHSQLRLSRIDAAEAEAETMKIGLIQTNYGVRERLQQIRQGARGRDAMLDTYLLLSREAAEQGAEVVVWPEGASPYRPNHRRHGPKLTHAARDLGVEFWMGATRIIRGDDGEREARNTAWHIDAEGELRGTYDKMFLLPFGEYMPGRDLFPALTTAVQGVGNYRAGTEFVVFNGPRDTTFSFLICYEAIRTLMARAGVRRGSRLLVNITFDDWFGTSDCLHQHLMLSAIQGAIYGMPLVRSATTGISAYADARGILVDTTQPQERVALVSDVKLVHVPSLFTTIGHTFSYLMCLLAVLLLWVIRLTPAPPSPTPEEPTT